MTSNQKNYHKEKDIIYLHNTFVDEESHAINGNPAKQHNAKVNFNENGNLTRIYATDSRLLDVLGFVLERTVTSKEDGHLVFEYYIFSLEIGNHQINSFSKLVSPLKEDIAWPDEGLWPVPKIDLEQTTLHYYSKNRPVSTKAFNMLACLGAQLRQLPFQEGIDILLNYIGDEISLECSADAISVRKQLLPLLNQLQENFTAKPITHHHMQLICKKPLSIYEYGHYFLMRLVNGDLEGAEYLLSSNVDIPKKVAQFASDKSELPWTLLRSQVDVIGDSNDELTTIICHGICDDNDYGTYAINIKLQLCHDGIVSCTPPSVMEVDQCQVDFALGMPTLLCCYNQTLLETDGSYISVQDLGTKALLDTSEEIQKIILSILPTAQIISYGHSITYILYQPHNNYLDKAVYNISDDVLCRIMITDFGELVIFCQLPEDLLFYKNLISNSIKVFTENHLTIDVPNDSTLPKILQRWSGFEIPSSAVEVYNNVQYGNIYVEPAPFKDFLELWLSEY